MITKTIVPRMSDTYAAFPAFVTHAGSIYLYYRKGTRSKDTPHGRAGRVHCLVFDQDEFSGRFGDPQVESLFHLGRDHIVFADHNEMDAIVSHPEPGRFTLATRHFDDQRNMRTFMSFSDRPVFDSRFEVCLPELDWLAFYGKAISQHGQIIFTAYGSLEGESFGRPLILSGDAEGNWELLAALPSFWDSKTVLNECSLVAGPDGFHLFMRQDLPPFGLWHAVSTDLRNWSQPKPLCIEAQAPMAVVSGDRLLVTYRLILEKEKAATAIWAPFETKPPQHLDVYEGNIYDGGYSSPGFIGEDLFIFYYHGNRDGEPHIKACCLNLRQA